MKHLAPRTGLYFGLDVALLLVCIFHIPDIMQRPCLPFEAGTIGDRVEVLRVLNEPAAGGIRPGNRILAGGITPSDVITNSSFSPTSTRSAIPFSCRSAARSQNVRRRSRWYRSLVSPT